MEQPICRHLRTKKMFLPASPPEEKSQDQCEPHCWCNLTMTEVGEDDRIVNRQKCVPGRACYRV